METFWGNISAYEHEAYAGVTALGNNRDSTWDLIKLVLKQRADSDLDSVILTLQKQTVDRNRKFKAKQIDTAQELCQKLQELLRESGTVTFHCTCREKLRSLQEEVEVSKLPPSTHMRFFGRVSVSGFTKGL
jgi:hypothetical protein